MTIGFSLAVALFLWVGWLSYQHIISPAPTEADIAQQATRFNQAGYTKVTTLTTQYHQPLVVPAFPRNPFLPTP